MLPVLVGDAVPFAGEWLPRSLRALTEIQAELIRPQRVDEDVAHPQTVRLPLSHRVPPAVGTVSSWLATARTVPAARQCCEFAADGPGLVGKVALQFLVPELVERTGLPQHTSS